MAEPCPEPDAPAPFAPQFHVAVPTSRTPLVQLHDLFGNQPAVPVVSKHAPPSYYPDLSAHRAAVENKNHRTFVPGLRPPHNVMPPFVNFGVPVAPSWAAPPAVPPAQATQQTRRAPQYFDDFDSSDDASDTPPARRIVPADTPMAPENPVQPADTAMEFPSAATVAIEPASQPGITDECGRKRSRKIKTLNPSQALPPKARPQWAKAEEVAAFRAAWAASSEWGKKPKKYLIDMAAKNYETEVYWMVANDLWKKHWGDVDCVPPDRSIEVRSRTSQRFWQQ